MSKNIQSLYVVDGIKESLINMLVGVSSILLGKPGIGKTEIVHSIEDKPEYIFDKNLISLFEEHTNKKFKDITFKILSTELHSIPDEYLSGLPKYNKDLTSTAWTKPEIISTLDDLAEEADFVIWFVDDIHRSNKNKQDYFFELLSHRSIHGFKIKDNVHIIGAGNDSAAAGKMNFMTPIISRFVWLDVSTDFEKWVDTYGYKKDIHPVIMSFLNSQNYNFETSEHEGPFASPRTWTMVDNIIKIREKYYGKSIFELMSDIDNKEDILIRLFNLVKGTIGLTAGSAFIKYLSGLHEIKNITEYLKNPDKFNQISNIENKVTIIYFINRNLVNQIISNKECDEFKSQYKNLIKSILNNNGGFITKDILLLFAINDFKRLLHINKINKKVKILREVFPNNVIKSIKGIKGAKNE